MLKKNFKGKKSDISQEKSFFELNYKEKEPGIMIKIREYFLEKQLKKYKGGITGFENDKAKDVGMVMVLTCDNEFYQKFVEKKEKIQDPELKLNAEEELPIPNDPEYPQNPRWAKLISDLNAKKSVTTDFIYNLIKALTLDKFNKEYLDRYLEKYSAWKNQKLREEDPKKLEFYEKYKHIVDVKKVKKIKTFIEEMYEKIGYFEWTYEDFLINFLSLIKFFTGLKLSLEIESNKKIFVKLFCSYPQLKGLAQAFEQNLQLKNYGLKYYELSLEIKKQRHEPIYQETETNLLIRDSKEPLQFHELDQHSQFYFPSYSPYELNKDTKFRRYTKNDQYHDCPNDPDFSRMELTPVLSTMTNEQFCCSNMRNLDKIRLIYRAFDEVVRLKRLKENEYLDSVIFIRNYDAYKERLETE